MFKIKSIFSNILKKATGIPEVNLNKNSFRILSLKENIRIRLNFLMPFVQILKNDNDYA